MISILKRTTFIYPSAGAFHIGLLIYRMAVCLQLMIVHGSKKIGMGVAEAHKLPNPYHLPDLLNDGLAIASNLFFPVLVMLGVFTRLSVLPILAVTLTGYFVVHLHDSAAIKDIPFMYSICYLLILVLGPGRYSADHLFNKWL